MAKKPTIQETVELCNALMALARPVITFVAWKQLGYEVPAGWEDIFKHALRLHEAMKLAELEALEHVPAKPRSWGRA